MQAFAGMPCSAGIVGNVNILLTLQTAGSDNDWEVDNSDPDSIQDFQSSPRIDTGQAAWGSKALRIAQKVLRGPKMKDLDLYAFQAVSKSFMIDIRLDKMTDEYGSPSLDEISEFSRDFYSELELEIGEEEAGRISVEVSTPGAEREIRLPHELQRFSKLPMSVTYLESKEGKEMRPVKVLQLLDEETTEEFSVWQLANVKLNRAQGRQMLSKKQQAQRFLIPVANLVKVNLFLDM